MSKIFDALRRAEEERRKRAALSKDAKVIRERRVPATPLPRSAVNGFPAELLRELGLLRNSIESSLRGKTKKTLLFTSATRAEGTTTIGSSYARLLALHGEDRVLLCEMNARNPWFKRMFVLSNDSGITDYFSGSRDLTAIVHSIKGSKLDVIHVGQSDPALIQVHLQQGFPELIKEASAIYGTVIFDAPAVVSSPETPPMSSYVDGVILVVHAGKTKREVVQRSMEAIAQFEGNVLGVILNRKKYYIPEFLYKRI